MDRPVTVVKARTSPIGPPAHARGEAGAGGVEGVSRTGAPLTKGGLSHAAIATGGELRFTLVAGDPAQVPEWGAQIPWGGE